MNTKDNLARVYWYARLRNVQPNASDTTIEDDGRKRKATVRALIEEGIIGSAQGHEGGPLVYPVQTSFAEAHIAAEKPDLAALTRVDTLHDLFACDHVEAPLLERLSTTHLRHIAEHKSEYRFEDPRGPVPVLPDFRGYWGELRVRDDAFDAAVAAKRRDLQIARATKGNLAWGLLKAGLIEPVDKDLFNSREEDTLSVGLSGFGSDPDLWEVDAERILGELRKRIAEDTRRANAIETLCGKMGSTYGWARFVAAYKERIVAAVDAELAAKAAKESEPKEPE